MYGVNHKMQNTEDLKSAAINGIAEFVVKYTREDITPAQIFNETRYLEVRELINENDIELRLMETPLLVDDWIKFSEDQRHTPAWIILDENNKWKIGHVGRDGKISNMKEFNNKLLACAYYIKRFMEFMADKNG